MSYLLKNFGFVHFLKGIYFIEENQK